MDSFVKALVENAKNTPYFHLDGYIDRWWLAPYEDGKPVSMRIHHIQRSDEGAFLHDHPWPSISIPLDSGYFEKLPLDQSQAPALDSAEYTVVWRAPGDVVSRKASDRHQILLDPGKEAWSLFIMGPWEKDWGFYLPTGFVYWRDHLQQYEPDDPPPGASAVAR